MKSTKIPCLLERISAGLWMDLQFSWARAVEPDVACKRDWACLGGSRRDFFLGGPSAAAVLGPPSVPLLQLLAGRLRFLLFGQLLGFPLLTNLKVPSLVRLGRSGRSVITAYSLFLLLMPWSLEMRFLIWMFILCKHMYRCARHIVQTRTPRRIGCTRDFSHACVRMAQVTGLCDSVHLCPPKIFPHSSTWPRLCCPRHRAHCHLHPALLLFPPLPEPCALPQVQHRPSG